jgi:Protein of unknown function (DUF2752)
MQRGDRVIAAFSGAALLASAAIPAGAFPSFIPCPFKMLTGWPCPGCGLTHAFCDISQGNLARAWMDNPFGFLFYALAIALLVWPFLAARVPSMKTALAGSRAACWAPPVLVVLMWAFDIVRIARG